MAGEWIKMRTNLWDDPRIANLCDITDQSEAAVIGALYWLWAMADEHTENGILPGLTLRAIDRKTGVQGIGTGLVSIGWLADHPEGVRIVGFEEHNGSSAKKRCSTAKRVASHRGGNDDVTHAALQDEHTSDTGALAREEKIREEEYTTTPNVVVVAPPKPRPSRKCPEGFSVNAGLKAWAEENHPGVDLFVETGAFRDHTFKTAISDWEGAWRNWIRKAFGFMANNPRASPAASRFPIQMQSITVPSEAAAETQRLLAEQAAHAAMVTRERAERLAAKAATQGHAA